MNTFLKYLFYLFFAAVFNLFFIGCQNNRDFSLLEEPLELPDEEFVSIPFEISFTDINGYKTKAEELNDTLTINKRGAVKLNIYIYYNNELIIRDDYSTSSNSFNDRFISPYITRLYDKEYSHKFQCVLPKRMDPSKVKLIFTATNRNYESDILFDYNNTMKDDLRLVDPYIFPYLADSNLPYYMGEYQLAPINDWNKVNTEFKLDLLNCRIIVLTDEFFDYPLAPNKSDIFSCCSFSVSPSDTYKNYFSAQISVSVGVTGLYGGFSKLKIPTSIYGIKTPTPYTELSNFTCRTNLSVIMGNSFFKIDDDSLIANRPNSCFYYKGRKMAAVCDINILCASKTKPTFPLDDTGTEYRYFKVMGYSKKPDYYGLLLDSNIPLPIEGLLQGKIYLIYNKPNSKLFDSYSVSDSGGYGHPQLNKIYAADWQDTRSVNNIIIEEYDMNEDLPFEMCNSEIPFSK